MDLRDQSGRAFRLLASAVTGGLVGIIVVAVFWQVLDRDRSAAPTWFAVFSWSATFILVTTGMNAWLAANAKRGSPVRIPIARVVRR